MIPQEEMLARAHAYVAASKDEPIEWGKSDCSPWAARWAVSVRGGKINMPSFSTRDEALRIIEEAGSLLNLWEDALADYCLFEQYGDPQPGDVGIIKTHIAGQVGGIFLNHGLFAWRANPGSRLLHPRQNAIVKVWAIQ